MIGIEGRFQDRVDREGPGGCWIWLGCITSSGYGQLKLSTGKSLRAHRISYELFFGPIPKGLSVLHKCDVRNCVNPDHLFLGTQADNMRDKMLKGRATGPIRIVVPALKKNGDTYKVRRAQYEPRVAITHCPQGHEYTYENTYIQKRGNTRSRNCRTCHRLACQKYDEAKRKLKYAL